MAKKIVFLFDIFVVVQLLSCVRLYATPWTAARQASLSSTISQSLLKLICIESVMPSNHLILCYSLLLLPSVFPRIRVFSTESALRIRWPKYWSFSFNISPSSECSGLIIHAGICKHRHMRMQAAHTCTHGHGSAPQLMHVRVLAHAQLDVHTHTQRLLCVYLFLP